jgi:hypothetical protein
MAKTGLSPLPGFLWAREIMKNASLIETFPQAIIYTLAISLALFTNIAILMYD